MNAIKILAIVLITAGVLALVYGSFGYTADSHQATLGAVDLSVKDQKTVNIPVWAGVVSIAVGSLFLVLISKRSGGAVATV